jgi:radical SAM protein with 4Fe4S-binding SPASM domain
MDLKRLIQILLPWRASPLRRAGVKPGLYHYMREAQGTCTRFHLRIDSTHNGMLLANAAAAARLRPSGVIIAKGLLEGDDEQTVAKRLVESFRDLTLQQAAADVDRLRGIIAKLDSPGDNYPIINLADPSYSPEASALELPLSADVPLARPDRLLPILDRLWELGIPHVTLIAGERSDPAALVCAVERAEDLGLIAGVRGRGTVLRQGSLIRDLAQAGADHLNILYLSARPAVHDALAGNGDHANAVEALAEAQENEVCPVAEVALVESTLDGIEETLEALAAAGISNACFFAIAMAKGKSSGGAIRADELVQAARLIEESAEESDVRYLWYPPVRFHLGSVLPRQVRRGPRSSGDHAVRVEPDGSVIPARGPYRPAGNLLKEKWKKIHRHEVFRKYRRRVETDTHCDDCPGLAICAADCPRNPEGWADRSGAVESPDG